MWRIGTRRAQNSSWPLVIFPCNFLQWPPKNLTMIVSNCTNGQSKFQLGQPNSKPYFLALGTGNEMRAGTGWRLDEKEWNWKRGLGMRKGVRKQEWDWPEYKIKQNVHIIGLV